MNIKKILICLIFAFVMILPFNVNAQNATFNLDSNLSYVLNQDNLLNSSDIDYIESIIASRISSLYTIDDVKYFVIYEEDKDGYRVYYVEDKDLYFTSALNDGTLSFHFAYEKSFIFQKDNDYVSTTTSSSSANFVSAISSIYKNNIRYSVSEAKEQLGFSWSDSSTWSDLYLELSIVYSNSDFVYVARPIGSTTYNNITSSQYKYDFPVFNNESNFPSISGTKLDLSPVLDFVGYDSDVTSVYHYYSENDSTVEVNILIGDKPFSCFNESWTFGDNLCINRVNYDYLDFYVVTDSTISSKIYTSTNGVDFKQTTKSNFIKDLGGYVLKKSTLGTFTNKYKSYKFVFSVPEDSYLTFRIKYNSTYLSVNFPTVNYADSLYTEYDLTGKYAIGLIPKYSGLNSSIKTLGDYTAYYKFSDDNYAYKYDELLSSNYMLKGLDFVPFNGKSNPIYYILNNNYDDNEYISKIKYLSSHFDVIEFESVDSLVTHGSYTYFAPDTNVTIKSNYDNFSNSSNSVINNNNLDFSNIFSNLPSFIVGLGSAFTALGACLVIVFGSLPEMVQSILWFALIVSVIVLVVKLLK